LGYLAAMLEAGVPVVYGYIEDAHDNHNFPANPDGAFGPGEADYEAQLKQFDTAFGKFFSRLAADGITKDNTLLVITSDENDHFAGYAPTPAGCDGIHAPCTYPPGHKGEADANLV
jgi:arylsulfatase A-like enzyme